MNFKKKYKEETGKSVNGTIVNRLIHLQYSEDYVNWLEQQLILSGVSKSVVCGNCDGYGYTVDENGRRKEHCNECE